MVVSKRVARINRVVTNRVARPLAGRLPGFGVVRHRGRRSGRTYRTPVNIFPAPDGYVIALVYGAGTDWVRNVTAAGGCEVEIRGRRVSLTQPRIVRDETRQQVPAVVRPALRAVGAAEFMHLRVADG